MSYPQHQDPAGLPAQNLALSFCGVHVLPRLRTRKTLRLLHTVTADRAATCTWQVGTLPWLPLARHACAPLSSCPRLLLHPLKQQGRSPALTVAPNEGQPRARRLPPHPPTGSIAYDTHVQCRILKFHLHLGSLAPWPYFCSTFHRPLPSVDVGSVGPTLPHFHPSYTTCHRASKGTSDVNKKYTLLCCSRSTEKA